MIILDSRRREVDDRMRRFFDRLQREGTPFAELDRIVDSLLLGPSHFSLGLQVADLVVGATLAAQRAPRAMRAGGSNSCCRASRVIPTQASSRAWG